LAGVVKITDIDANARALYTVPGRQSGRTQASDPPVCSLTSAHIAIPAER